MTHERRKPGRDRRHEWLVESFSEEDRRWQAGAQIGDWIRLLILILLNTGWMAYVFALEPGLR